MAGARRRHPTSIIERSVLGGDAALCRTALVGAATAPLERRSFIVLRRHATPLPLRSRRVTESHLSSPPPTHPRRSTSIARQSVRRSADRMRNKAADTAAAAAFIQ